MQEYKTVKFFQVREVLHLWYKSRIRIKIGKIEFQNRARGN